MLPFSPTGWEGKVSYACKLCSEKGVSRKELTKSSVGEEATGTGRPRGRALVGGWLASGVGASTLDNSPEARAGRGVYHVLPRLRPHPFAETEGPPSHSPSPCNSCTLALGAAEGWGWEVVF